MDWSHHLRCWLHLHIFKHMWASRQQKVSDSILTNCFLDYSQCLPGAPPSPPSTGSGSGSGLPFLGGVNMAGYDFSVTTDGSFTGTGVTPPPAQFAHFAEEGANIFRVRELDSH